MLPQGGVNGVYIMFRSSGFHQSIAVLISVAMWLGIIHFVSILIERVMQ